MTQHHFSRRQFLKTTALTLPLVAAGTSCAQPGSTPVRKAAGDFVTVRNGRFE